MLLEQREIHVPCDIVIFVAPVRFAAHFADPIFRRRLAPRLVLHASQVLAPVSASGQI